jgi:hypothetical protein
MEEKVLGDTDEDSLGEKNPLFGRRTAQIRLKPFGYRDAALMLPGLSSAELVEFYAVYGDTPCYLSMIDASASLRKNVEQLFFRMAEDLRHNRRNSCRRSAASYG